MNWPFGRRVAKATGRELGTHTDMLVERQNPEPPPWEAPEELVDPNQATDPDDPDAPDPLAEYSDEQRAQIETLLAEREAGVRQQVRSGLQQYGLDVTDDGSPAIRDPRAVSGWMGGAPQAAPPPPPPTPAPAPVEPQALGEPPDPYEDPKGFAAYMDRLVERRSEEKATAMVQPLLERLTRSEQRQVRQQMTAAMGQLPGAIRDYVPELEYLLEHPEFPQRFQEALAATDPDYWVEPQNLAMLASTLRIVLPPTRQPQAQAPAPQRAVSRQQPTGQSIGRSQVSRQAIAATAPSRGEGRGQTPREYDPVILEVAARMNISPEEVLALQQDTTGDAAAVLRQKRLAALKGSR